jgi:serine/threonine protein kinase
VEPVSLTPMQLDLPRALTPSRTVQGEADPLLGRIVAGEYRLLKLLGRGGMGAVYKVEHLPSGTLRAMKLLSGELAAHHEVVQRFRQEAWATQHLSHPNTVQVFDFGESDQLVYVVMEYLEGHDLSSLIRAEQRLPFERVAKIALQITKSVSEAHELGIIHCDIKPENVFVLSGDAEEVKVLDFGIAQLRDVDEPVEGESSPLVGTPYYMAPEQILRGRVDARTDVYALGALMYKALTGVAPFTAETPMAVLDKHLSERLVPMRERVPGLELSDAAERVVLKALSKEPAERQQSMNALADELAACLAGGGPAAEAAPHEPEQKRAPVPAPQP